MESFGEVLTLVKNYVRERVSEVAYNCWIDVIKPVKLDQSNAIIFIKTPFQRDVLTKQYLEKISAGFEEVLGFPVNVIIATEDTIKQYIGESFSGFSNLPPSISEVFGGYIGEDEITLQADMLSTAPSSLDDGSLGNYEFTFETFIVGSSNNFAYAACKAVSTQQSGAYNPLFIYGSSGLGKTHLLKAISTEIHRNFPDKNIISISSETFTNELISAIGSKSVNEFHNKYRKADVLLVDDIQFIAGKESTQEEFFHTFNELYQVGKQIVLTSDRPPKEIKTLEDRLKSRFEWGLLTDISPPDFETRTAIINRKAGLLNLEMPRDVSEFIANKVKTNIRQLEGIVKKIAAYKLYNNLEPSISLAQTVIKEILSDTLPIPLTVERIIEEVAKTYSVSPEDIRSKKRNANISSARQTAIYVIREITQLSLAAIGEEFNRDHSTIVYSMNQTKEQLEYDSHQRSIIDDIVKNIRNK